MDITKVHVPSRLEGESRVEYAIRRHTSKRILERGTVVCSANKVFPQAVASHADRQRHKLMAALGPRQAKKAIRAARALQKEAAHA